MTYNLQNLINLISTDFKDLLIELYKDNPGYFKQIEDFLNKEESDFNGFAEIYPKIENIFACFDKFNINDTKVVIIGQDPYHGPNQAHGLCFSVNKDIKIPPSLRNIYIEIEDDLGCKTNVNHQNGDLTYLAEQGILLLNTSLTVRQSKAGSHAKIWKEFTKLFLEKLNKKTKNIVYLLWGNHAKKYKDLVESNNYILEATHPSPLGANKGGWWKCKHFSKTNNILEKLNKNNINW